MKNIQTPFAVHHYAKTKPLGVLHQPYFPTASPFAVLMVGILQPSATGHFEAQQKTASVPLLTGLPFWLPIHHHFLLRRPFFLLVHDLGVMPIQD